MKKESSVFSHWAQPVTHPVWAAIATVLHAVMRATGYRLFGAATHRAWQKATA